MSRTYAVALIGARSGSKGVPGKNVRYLAGMPLLAYSIRAAKMARNIQRVIVSTDSDEYAEVAMKYGAEVFMRPAALATDESDDYAYVRHAIDRCVQFDPIIPHMLVLLRPTTPFRDPVVIREAVDTVRSESGSYTSMRSVHRAPESAYKQFEIQNDQLVPLGTETIETANGPRQALRPTYIANGYVDIISPKFVLESGTLYGDKVFALRTPSVREIDTEEDFQFLQYQAASDPATKKLISSLWDVQP